MKKFCIIALLALAPLTGLAQNGASAAPDLAENMANEDMNKLATAAIQMSVKAIAKGGSLYPFALLAKASGDPEVLGYKGEAADAPPPEQWASMLFKELDKRVADNPDVLAVALAKLHTVTGEKGEQVPGIWVLADHRDRKAVVIFSALVKQDNGKHRLAEPVYYAPENAIFPK